MKKIAGLLIFLCVLAYPFFVYWGINRYSLKVIGWVFLGVVVLRSFIFKQQFRQWFLLLAGITVTTVLLTVFNDTLYLKLNPVIISGCMCITFSLTLKTPPSMIETFARMGNKELPPAAVPYCRKVTIIWTVFLFLNTLAALYTCFCSDLKVWTFYNGFLSYILMGFLFAGEFLYRRIHLKEAEE